MSLVNWQIWRAVLQHEKLSPVGAYIKDKRIEGLTAFPTLYSNDYFILSLEEAEEKTQFPKVVKDDCYTATMETWDFINTESDYDVFTDGGDLVEEYWSLG